LLTLEFCPSYLPGLVYEIWHALQQLPYTDRFCIYADALKVRGASGFRLAVAWVMKVPRAMHGCGT